MIEIYELPLGRIIFGFSDEHLTVGLLTLNPGQALAKHSRPVREQLVQASGMCVMQLFEKDVLVKEVTLYERDRLEIPANQFHIHSNSSNERSITLFKFEGNVTEQVEKIRNTFKKVL